MSDETIESVRAEREQWRARYMEVAKRWMEREDAFHDMKRKCELLYSHLEYQWATLERLMAVDKTGESKEERGGQSGVSERATLQPCPLIIDGERADHEHDDQPATPVEELTAGEL